MNIADTKFQIESNSGAETVEISVSGFMDEFSRIDHSLVPAGTKEVVINFDGIKLINSIGIKNWVEFSNFLSSQEGLKIKFINCRKQVIDCINSIAGFLPENATIESFYIPLYCDKCDESFNVSTKMAGFNPDEFNLNSISSLSCDEFPSCKKYLDIDFNPSQYFRFLREE